MGTFRTFAVVAIALLGATCDAPANRPGAAAQPARQPEERRFDPAVVRAEPGSGLARVQEALDAGDADLALRRAEAAIERGGSLAEMGELRWTAAHAAIAAGQPVRGRPHLEVLGESPHPLSRWARLRLAELLREVEPAATLRWSEGITDEWAGGHRARVARANALVALDRTADAEPLLRALIEEAPDHVGAASAGMPLAGLLAARDDVASREEALALYRRVMTRAPLARVAEEASERADAVLASLPPERREALARIPVDDLFARGEAFYNGMHHQEAEDAFAELVEQLDADDARRCQARLMQGKAMLRRRERALGVGHMDRVAAECEDTDVRAWALYYEGKTHAQRGHRAQAIESYDALVEHAPSHRLADDALLRAAIAAEGEGDIEGMRNRLQRLPASYPDGDMRGDARFLLAWSHWEAAADHREEPERATEHLEAMVRELDASVREGTLEDDEDIRGRAEYWRARALVELERTDEAVEAYDEIFRHYPLSYYAQQSYRRLEELDPERAGTAVEWLRDSGDREPLTFPWRAELSSEPMGRALSLLRVRAIDEAEAELDSMGATGEGADPDMLWLVAALYDRAGAHPQASLLVRRRLGGFMATAPVGRGYVLWRIAYPDAFSPLIEEVAGADDVPPAFVRAVAREESAFNPNAVSVAHAYGLIQLIAPTARRFGDELDLPSTPADLRTPETNLRIGTRFIKFLRDRYPDNPAVVPSAYNAGERACDGWLTARGNLPLDAWIETIPYDETRRYTRRVLQTYGIYTWLDTATLPPLRRQLPRPHRRR